MTEWNDDDKAASRRNAGPFESEMDSFDDDEFGGPLFGATTEQPVVSFDDEVRREREHARHVDGLRPADDGLAPLPAVRVNAEARQADGLVVEPEVGERLGEARHERDDPPRPVRRKGSEQNRFRHRDFAFPSAHFAGVFP